MPPPLPERFRLEVRLGRDHDLEEWLATDTSLDRPVLIRFLGPESSDERRQHFVRAVRAASAVSHPHLASVYQVETLDDGAFSVSEWTGGATLASRIDAEDTIDPDEFLPNAAGLAAALAELHDSGVIHGAIDTSAITYTVAHPAKLGAFGRPVSAASSREDVAALSVTLEEALTGSPPGGPPPSESIDGLSPAVDRILVAARGALSAQELSESFASAPSPRRAQPESPRPSRRLLLVALGLVVAAAGLVGLGRIFTPSGVPILPPPAPIADQEPPPSTTIPATTTTTLQPDEPAETLEVGEPATLDPFGGGGENDGSVGAIVDGDLSSAWRTELYRDPLPLLKPGVGVMVDVSGTPTMIDLLGLSEGTELEVGWASVPGDTPDQFERIARVVAQPGVSSLQLPAREDGTWLVWLTDLPLVGDTYSASISEVRFRP